MSGSRSRWTPSRDTSGAQRFAAFGDFVDFIEKDDTGLFDAFDCPRFDIFFVDEPRRFFFARAPQRIFDLQPDGAFALVREIRKHALQLVRHFFHARRGHDFHTDRRRGQLEFDFFVVEFAFAQSFAEQLPCSRIRTRGTVRKTNWARLRQQRVQNSFFSSVFGAQADFFELLLTQHFYSSIGKVANDRLDVATHVANFGEFGGFDLDERRPRQFCETPRNFRLTDAGRSDHQNVLRRHFVAQRLIELHTPPTVAERNCDGAFGGILANDVFVQFVDDFARGHHGHGHESISSTSMVRL